MARGGWLFLLCFIRRSHTDTALYPQVTKQEGFCPTPHCHHFLHPGYTRRQSMLLACEQQQYSALHVRNIEIESTIPGDRHLSCCAFVSSCLGMQIYLCHRSNVTCAALYCERRDCIILWNVRDEEYTRWPSNSQTAVILIWSSSSCCI